MLTFINTLLDGLELPLVLEIPVIAEMVTNAQNWWNCLNPQLIFSIIFYLACLWGIFSLTLRFMYRIVKKIVKYPHSKGCEFK